MAIFPSATPAAQNPESSLRLPAEKRISTPVSERLSTITEGPNAGANKPRGILRSNRSSGAPSGYSADTQRTAPPAYEWVPERLDGLDEEVDAPANGEKLAQLRQRASVEGRRSSRRSSTRERGGWGRLALILIVVLLVAIALGVGLGAGLKKRKNSKDGGGSQGGQESGTTPSSGVVQDFPLGEYSIITALRAVNTNCTSNPATWRCYPYSVFSPSDSSTNTTSLATFNWVISNTTTEYATNTSAATPEQGIPSNLTISSTDNPFSISFTNESLTYINTSGNSTSARYTFSFQMSKVVIPSSALTSDNVAAECFFNLTTFTGTLYLAAERTFPGASLADSSGLGGYTPWPYAVEVTQSSPGGQHVPDCYEMVNGAVGAPITTATTPEAGSEICLCDYRNY